MVTKERLADNYPDVIAIAADHETDGRGLPVFALDDVKGIADFIAANLGLGRAPPHAAAVVKS
jgi:molybdopterin-guanine dinucleotide biosynthesis protein B